MGSQASRTHSGGFPVLPPASYAGFAESVLVNSSVGGLPLRIVDNCHEIPKTLREDGRRTPKLSEPSTARGYKKSRKRKVKACVASVIRVTRFQSLFSRTDMSGIRHT